MYLWGGGGWGPPRVLQGGMRAGEEREGQGKERGEGGQGLHEAGG